MAANVTSPTATPAFSSTERATSSGKLPGEDTAIDLPLRSATELMPLRTNRPCGTTSQLQPITLMSAPRDAATIDPPGPPSNESRSRDGRLELDRVGLHRHEFELEAELLRKIAPARHVEDARVALRLDDAVAPHRLCRSRHGHQH